MSRKIKIGNLTLKNRFILAPMAGITNSPFRLIAKRFGAALVTTEMISAKGLCLNQKRTLEYLKHSPEEDPLSVQIFGSEPEIMADAAQIVIESGAKIVDINMGCPVKKVIKIGAGGALLRDLKKAERVINAIRKVCNVPLTLKIRAGWSPEKCIVLEVAKMARDCGVDAITIHPRFVTQGFSGKANWSIIAKVKDKIDMTIIGNGDVFTANDALRMIKETGCDGVMIARGAIGNPWIFREILALQDGKIVNPPDLSERKKVMLEHFSLIKDLIGEEKAIKYIKGVFIWYSKGLPYSSYFRERIAKINNENELMSLLDKYFSILEEKK